MEPNAARRPPVWHARRKAFKHLVILKILTSWLKTIFYIKNTLEKKISIFWKKNLIEESSSQKRSLSISTGNKNHQRGILIIIKHKHLFCNIFEWENNFSRTNFGRGVIFGKIINKGRGNRPHKEGTNFWTNTSAPFWAIMSKILKSKILELKQVLIIMGKRKVVVVHRVCFNHFLHYIVVKLV